MRNYIIIAFFACCLCYTSANAQQSAKWGDQGDGTFRNPVFPVDYSDPDFIHVGNDYYGISSTLQESPGMIVIHSKDLVNWEILGHVVSDISLFGR
jgi:beta-xylosidase